MPAGTSGKSFNHSWAPSSDRGRLRRRAEGKGSPMRTSRIPLRQVAVLVILLAIAAGTAAISARAESVGVNEAQPAAAAPQADKNETPAGKANNRRVEFIKR